MRKANQHRGFAAVGLDMKKLGKPIADKARRWFIARLDAEQMGGTPA